MHGVICQYCKREIRSGNPLGFACVEGPDAYRVWDMYCDAVCAERVEARRPPEERAKRTSMGFAYQGLPPLSDLLAEERAKVRDRRNLN